MIARGSVEIPNIGAQGTESARVQYRMGKKIW